MRRKKKVDIPVNKKCISYYVNRTPLLDFLTNESKNAYNKILWLYKTYKRFEYDILLEDDVNEKFIEVVNNYSNNYETIKQQKQEMYNELHGYVICNDTYQEWYDYFIENNYNEVAIQDVLESRYNYFYYKTKYELTNNKPVTFRELEEFVRNNNHVLYNKKEIITIESLRKSKKLSEELLLRKCFKELYGDQFKLNPGVIDSLISKFFYSIKSYYSLREKGFKCSKPMFKKTNDKHLLIYESSVCNKINNKIRLSLHKEIQKEYGLKFLYFDIPKKFINKNINYVEIVPHLNKYKICLTYNEERNIINNNMSLKTVSIDLGLVNHFTVYQPDNYPVIIKLSNLNRIQSKYNRLLDKCTIYDDYYYELCRKRNNKVNGAINKFVEDFTNMFHDVGTFIVGYNENWKHNCSKNLNNKNNRKWNNLPFRTILNKLKTKLEKQSKTLIEVNEAYTSKCSSLHYEKLSYKETYKGTRTKRGLYVSDKGILNADVNAAINIMRKKYPDHVISNTTLPLLFNPYIIKC